MGGNLQESDCGHLCILVERGSNYPLCFFSPASHYHLSYTQPATSTGMLGGVACLKISNLIQTGGESGLSTAEAFQCS